MPSITNQPPFEQSRLGQMLNRVQSNQDAQLGQLQHYLFMMEQSNPKAPKKEILQYVLQKLYDKDMNDLLFKKHWANSQFNMKQRRDLGIPDDLNEPYKYKYKGLQDLWNPKPEMWM